ncbi:MAG: 3-deoxy-7-phosphoheptulonate synthase [Candidatus Methylacidiphilales bacterium]|nr:3-deoxy-7-phosphoheptulonate synthase [Candidatus Methylacidiphilales bacterium]
MLPVDDVRISHLRPLLPPAILIEEIPVAESLQEKVSTDRAAIRDVFAGRDDRLVVIVGPCSIHDPSAALDYATRLKPVADRLKADLLVVMRVYFEKPRTTVGWKGLINDPNLDNSFEINKGLRTARALLRDVVALGLPAATEFLDTITPQFIADLVSWGAIGARTTESQIHRELASGLSMTVGFKNGTGGNIRMAVDAIRSARSPHWFPSVTKQGVAAIFGTKGNDSCHLILRGGSRTGPNYGAEHVREAVDLLQSEKLPHFLMVDCSHGNSNKDHLRQADVAANLSAQIAGGQTALAGVMLESHLVGGRQDYVPGNSVYGQSITDACLSFDQTLPLLDELAAAVRSRRARG